MTKQILPEQVGYKHPPREHQFQPGQSGNPAGRPKGQRSLQADLRKELASLTSFRDGDRLIEISKQEVLIKKLVASAMDGDPRAVATVLSMGLRISNDDEREVPEDAPEDREIRQIFANPATAGGTAPTGNDQE